MVMIDRAQKQYLERMLRLQPAVGLLGPRQVGKTTLARSIADGRPSLYLDLESPLDQAKLTDPLAFFAAYQDTFIVLDEIHRAPGLFQPLRGIIDEGRQPYPDSPSNSSKTAFGRC